MATTGGQPGNQNAAKARRWREAIMRALARKAETVEGGLDKAADKLVALAIDDGDKWAIEEIGNRFDGKPAQTIAGDPDAPLEVIQRIERVLKRANPSDRDR